MVFECRVGGAFRIKLKGSEIEEMQSNWPGLPNWVLSKVVESSSLAESGQKWSTSDSVSPVPCSTSQSGQFPSSGISSTTGHISKSVSHFNFTPSAGKAAIGGGLAAVLQAAGGLLRFLGRGGSSKFEKRRGQRKRILKQDVMNMKSVDVLKIGGTIGTFGSQVEKRAGAASLLLNRVTSLLLENLGKIRNRNALPTMVAALLPPVIHSPANHLSFPTKKDMESEKSCIMENFEEAARHHGKPCRMQSVDGVIVEPKTGVCFPVHLKAITDDFDSSHQVLAGVGSRAKTLIKLKSIMIYAFGLYVQPDQLRAKIGRKYSGVSPEELKYRAEFYDDLLSQGVDMTIRLVVHYKGLKMGMVRSAFESSLKSRLKKIKGAEEDNGLRDFCSLMSQDVNIFQGTTIDFRWQPGGALQTEVGGRRIGTVFSHHLCRAFFEMYIGDPPVSEPAKREIGESFARLLSTSSTL